LLADQNRRRELGERARDILRANSGATARTVAALESLLTERSAAATARAAASKISPRLET
jgi:hypothetical protein